jgi:7,8-dihydro-6-hydroxymethylpterin-pyrophosphokinase
MHQRAFVLSPLLEVDPLAQIPRLGAAADWAKECAGQRIERLGPLTDAKGDAPPAGPTAFLP